jgi:phenylacetate-CoA ligase
LYQLQQSQWWSTEDIQNQQFQQLNELMTHVFKTVPYYQQSLRDAGFNDHEVFTPLNWSHVPILTPSSLTKYAGQITSNAIPSEHGKIARKKTSGSSGNQVSVLGTEVSALFWYAFTLRDHLWHKRDVSGKLVAIRSGRFAKDPDAVHENPGWGIASNLVFKPGSSTLFYNLTPIERQAELLTKHNPDYLLAYPGVILRLANYFQKHKMKLPNIKQVLTFGEPTTAEIQTNCNATWDVSCKDAYSTEEIGYIALQCPETDNYHIQSESLLVEVINDEGNACKTGETGRVILTTLHNYAMPLIRYEIGDYAEVGEPCPCGRGLPTLKRILGRKRNRATLPDGRRLWPQLSSNIWSGINEIDCIQIKQKTLNHLEIGVVTPIPLTQTDEGKLTGSLHQVFGHPFECTYSYLGDIPCHANGKFEPFISELT